MKISQKAGVVITASLFSSFFTAQLNAAGFALIENSASGMGNAFAGGSAIADDASTVWFNPAGMTRLSGEQITAGLHFISPSAQFNDAGSSQSAAAGGAPLSGNEDDGGTSAIVPNFYYVTELGNGSRFGVGVSVPFGLSTEYDEGWMGRYHATKSEVQTLNINPSFAFKFNDSLSLGLGLSLQYVEATLENHIDSALTCIGVMQAAGQTAGAAQAACVTNPAGPQLVPGNLAQDSSQSMNADDWSWGWNIGALYEIDQASRVGVAYRSSIDANTSGSVDFTVDPAFQGFLDANFTGTPLAAFLTDTTIQAAIELPAQLSVSYVRDVNADLTVMADVTWTEWSNFDALVIKFDNLAQPTSVQPENWEDSYRYALGANYRVDDKMLLRFGIALDQTPVPSAEDRTARIPGDERTWVSLGLGYQLDANTSIDVGYSHLSVDDADINNTVPNSGQILLGQYEADVDIFSVQGNFKF